MLPKKLRISLSKLRLSSHKLLIETGRYGRNRIERAERHCCIYNSTDLEDEYHFVIICPVYENIREKNNQTILY